jgi:PAS domain S-box-containing protein
MKPVDARADDDWSLLFASLPIGAYRSTLDGRPVRANPALVRLNGYTTEAELIAGVGDIGREWYVDPTRREAFRQALARDGQVCGFVSQVYRHRSREPIWVSENAYVARGPQGEPLYYEGTVEDITAQVELQERLQRRNRTFSELAAQLPGVAYRAIVEDLKPLRFEFISDGVQDVYGVSVAEVMADPMLLRRMRHPDDAAMVEKGLADAHVALRTYSSEFRIIHRDGSVRWLHGLSTPVRQGEHGQVRTGVILDVTARHRADELRRDLDVADARRRATGQLLSRVSHELRTPLNAVLGFAQLLGQDAQLPELQRSWAGQILESGRHLLALVEDVLDLSRAEGGEFRIALQPVDVAEALAGAWSQVAGQAESAGITLRSALTPGLRVGADPQRLRQVLLNLLSNAVKYNRRGGRVELRTAAEGDQVLIEVADTGPGLDPDQRERLFQPFDRLGAERGPQPGTGLGLALSRELLRAMNGSIDVSSTLGEGSCFSVRLPRAAAAGA